MNTKHLKAYAPKARLDFLDAVTKRAAQFGLYEDRIADMKTEGSSTIIEGRIFTRQEAQQRTQLVSRINAVGFNQFINEAAFTWVNRLTAIRYMEINEYLDHGFRVLSKSEGAKFGEGFEILAHAVDVADDLGLDKPAIVEMLLDGDKEEALYREILLGQCHQLSRIMPFMFEKLDDATELLLPDNLTKTDSILKELVNDIPEEDWHEIEVIGWLYQFYISEHKDAVMGKVVKSEDIPAATQLFTPNWIVKYLVQNSVGRQWLSTYPDSELKDKMEYYITPAEQSDDVVAELKAITPTSIDPESIKVLDPACGSGHILVEVYEVLREIYLERGYRLREIPELILTKNIFGLDIDDRAAQMAAFAVLMKAREDDRRIFDRIADNDIKLNIYSLQSTEHLDVSKLWLALDLEGKQKSGAVPDLFGAVEDSDNTEMSSENSECLALLRLIQSAFLNAKNLGSLIDIQDELNRMLIALNLRLLNLNGEFNRKDKLKEKLLKLKDSKSVNEAYELVEELKQLPSEIKQVNDDIALFKTLEHDLFNKLKNFKNVLLNIQSKSDSIAISASNELIPFVEQTLVLLSKYDAVVANPPYMGGKGMNKELKDFAKKSYPNSKSDLFAMFMERAFNFLNDAGYNAQVNMQSWMFLSSFEKMRESLLDTKTFITMAHLGARAFGQISGEVVQTTAWVMHNRLVKRFQPSFLRLIDGNESEKRNALINRDNLYTHARANDFKCVPTSPIAYWLTESHTEAFNSKKLREVADAKQGMATSDNDRFLRYWFEVDFTNCAFNCLSNQESESRNERWYAYNKGGSFRRWFGNNEYVVNWQHSGKELKAFVEELNKIRPGGRLKNQDYYFRENVTYSAISSGPFSARYNPKGFLFDTKGSCIFPNHIDIKELIALLNSNVAQECLNILCPTLDYSSIGVNSIPVICPSNLISVERLIEIAENDWNSKETSWAFKQSKIIFYKSTSNVLKDLYTKQLSYNLSLVNEAKELEESNNKSFIDAYGMQNIISPKVKIEDISLHSNPYFVYSGQDNVNDDFHSAATNELLSYSFGCMMGRYSLDREGLVYAHSGNNGFKELVAEGAYNTFPADDDGIIPLASEDWLFDDDATTRFKEFVKTVWGEEHLQENLDFVAESLCLDAIKPKNNESTMDTIRRYFSTQFYKDHLKTYKKRPIYWLFSSGKEKAFECLVYLHRYNEGTLSRMRTEYVTPLMGKLETQHTLIRDGRDAATTVEQRRMDKELKSIEKKQAELRTFDEELKHIAEMKISLDLDDGVKVNYGKFGNLLSDVKGIHGKKPEVIK